jgi:hypothetical protein
LRVEVRMRSHTCSDQEGNVKHAEMKTKIEARREACRGLIDENIVQLKRMRKSMSS